MITHNSPLNIPKDAAVPRPTNPDLTKKWKVCLPATLAGTVEFYLFDRLHNKPRYGSRAKLITELLEAWVAEQTALAKQESPDART